MWPAFVIWLIRKSHKKTRRQLLQLDFEATSQVFVSHRLCSYLIVGIKSKRLHQSTFVFISIILDFFQKAKKQRGSFTKSGESIK
jgi:hypothetical protein